MALHGGIERPWSDLPADLLSAIYLRSASAYDRGRFAAVCTPWRAAAAWHPRLPALPLLLLSTGQGGRDREAQPYSPEDGRAVRVPLPWLPWGNRLVGSYDGGWIATVSRYDSDELLIVNLFSGVRAMRTTTRFHVQKIVFSKDPSSGDCIIAALTTSGTVALHRIGSLPNNGWTTEWCDPDTYRDLIDIAFCDGELFGVTSRELIVFNTDVDREDNLQVDIRACCIDVSMSGLYDDMVPSTIQYIFQLHGNLAIAVEVDPAYSFKNCEFFRVFEIVENDDDSATLERYTWAEVTSLGDHALFLGPAGCCKAVHVSAACRRGGVEGNCIYFSRRHNYFYDKVEGLTRLDIGSCTVYCWGSRGVHHLERIPSWGYRYRNVEVDANGCNACVWLWPPDF